MSDTSFQTSIERLEALEAIRHLKALYCLHCDRDYDPDALAPLFTEDAVWDAGPVRGVHRGRAAIHAFFVQASARIPYAAHLVTNSIIEVDGDQATGIWRMLMPCEMGGEGGRFAAFQVGRYDETYRRVDGMWLIETLKVQLQRLTVPGVAWVDFASGSKT
ncbi:nuclear transport factor 2 family protein [Mesorhizobium sp. A623]